MMAALVVMMIVGDGWKREEEEGREKRKREEGRGRGKRKEINLKSGVVGLFINRPVKNPNPQLNSHHHLFQSTW